MSVERLPSDVLSAPLALALLDFIDRSGPFSAQALVAKFAVAYPGNRVRAAGALDLFNILGLVRVEGSVVLAATLAVAPEERNTQVASLVARAAAKYLQKQLTTTGAVCKAECGRLAINSVLIPLGMGGLRQWILEFGVASRADIQDRYWIIGACYTPEFVEAIRRANEEVTQGKKSPEQLSASMRAQAIAGAEAEEWVLAFEKRRLALHPFADQIRRISLERVDAGYDIASFANVDSLTHDLFIEVKSYARDKRFFWSTGEIETARELGERYCLCLVNRELMNEIGYVPQRIVGPYAAFFDVEPRGWQMTASSYEFVELTSNQLI